MGFLRKLGIIEENPEYSKADVDGEMESIDLDDVEVQLDGISTDTLIHDIYLQNTLDEDAKSIFKVEEVINSLPKEMVTETKRNTVVSILASFGLTITDVVEDGEKRLTVLNTALKKIEEEARLIIADMQNEIETYKLKIAELEKSVSLKNNEIDKSKEVINAEVKRLTILNDFMNKGENK